MSGAEILDQLRALWAGAESTDEFAAALFEVAVQHAESARRMSQLVAALRAAHPETFREIVTGATLQARFRSQAWMLGQFLADSDNAISQFAWCIDHEIEPKKLQRALSRYRDDDEFRALADSRAEIWREFQKKTLP